jgi:hypothetical protein
VDGHWKQHAEHGEVSQLHHYPLQLDLSRQQALILNSVAELKAHLMQSHAVLLVMCTIKCAALNDTWAMLVLLVSAASMSVCLLNSV